MINKILNFFKRNYYLLSGLLIFLSFPAYDTVLLKGFTFFAWISLVPLLIYVRGKNYKEVLFSSFIAGFTGNYLTYSWIGDFGANVDIGYYVILAFMIPSLTVFFITKIIIAEYLARKFETLRLFILPGVWIFIDWIQSIGFLAFPWTYWGYSQFKFMPFMQLSSFVGIMGITFIIILGNNILCNFLNDYLKKEKIRTGLLRNPEFKKALSFAAFLIIITITGEFIVINSEKPEKKDMRIAVVQSCISPWENWIHNRFTYLRQLEYYTGLALKDDPDFIIWSESATLENISYDYAEGNLNPFERRVLEIAKESGKPLLTGEIGVTEGENNYTHYPQNNAVLIDKDGRVTGSYAKMNLVPFGEWFPYERWFPFLKGLLAEFGASNFVPGSAPLLFNTMNRKFGVLICYEDIFFRLCRKYKNMGSEFLVNITNIGWTHSYAGHMQQFAASRFRAVENGIWFVCAGNTGLTALIDPYGRIIDSIPILKKGYMLSDIDFDQNHKTFYSRYGDIFFYISAAFIFVLTILLIYRYFLKLYKNYGK